MVLQRVGHNCTTKAFAFFYLSSGDGDIFFNRNQSQIFSKLIYRVYTVLTKVLGALNGLGGMYILLLNEFPIHMLVFE